MKLRLSVLICFLIFGYAIPKAQQLSVQGGNQVLTISTAVVGSEPTNVVNTNTSLRYRRQSNTTKITVQTSCASQRFTLKVVALNPTGGTAAPEVTLTNGMPAVDFVTSIPTWGATTKTCTLQYTASATFADGNSSDFGNDRHRVTYTLVRQ